MKTYIYKNEEGKYICPFCLIEFKQFGIIVHIERKHLDKEVKYNPWSKGLTKETDERIKKDSDLKKQKFKDGTLKHHQLNKKRTIEEKKKISIGMQKAVKENPDSYSAKNVCGRTKLIEIKDSFNNLVKVNGGWEFLVAEFLNRQNIKWINKIEKEFYYEFENKKRRYFPDFYLPEYDKYIEVKGYEREIDLEKWKVLGDKLIIIKKEEINKIKNNNFFLKL